MKHHVKEEESGLFPQLRKAIWIWKAWANDLPPASRNCYPKWRWPVRSDGSGCSEATGSPPAAIHHLHFIQRPTLLNRRRRAYGAMWMLIGASAHGHVAIPTWYGIRSIGDWQGTAGPDEFTVERERALGAAANKSKLCARWDWRARPSQGASRGALGACGAGLGPGGCRYSARRHSWREGRGKADENDQTKEIRSRQDVRNDGPRK